MDTFEKWVRRAAGLGFVVFMAVVCQGLVASARRPKGRSSGTGGRGLCWLRAGSLPVSAIAFFGLSKLWRPLPLRLSPAARLAATLLGSLLYFPGLALFLWGRRTMGDMYDLSSALGAELYADHRLVTSGPFAFVRHPLYLGGQLAAVGALLLFRNWAMVLAAASAPMLIFRARREEEALAAEFGPRWEEYHLRVPMLLPRPQG